MHEEILDYDMIVRMPPRKTYSINLEIISIKKAEFKIIEPDDAIH